MKKLLEKYPDAVCVNIGCGLDDRFSRVDNRRSKWFNVDLPDSIEVRRKIFKETEREHMLAGDILVADWTRQIPQATVTIVIAEGLLMYFSKEQVKTILNNITSSFGRGLLLAELIKESSFWDEMKKYTLVGKIGSVLAKDLNNRLAVYKWRGSQCQKGF